MSFSLTFPGGATVTLTPPPPSDLEVALAFRNRCNGIGVNFERRRFKVLAWNGRPVTDPAYPKYLRADCGVSHGRHFFDFGFSGAGQILQKSDVLDLMPMIANEIAAGWQVFVDAIDVLQIDEARAHDAQLCDWLAMFGDVIAAQGFPVGSIAVGSVNEAADKANADWLPFLTKYHGILRAKLPQHVLSFSSADWGNYGGSTALNAYDNRVGIADGTLPALLDRRTVYRMHDYDTSNAGAPADTPATWAVAAAACDAWSRANGGAPIVADEFGWIDAAGIVAAARGMPALRPMMWCITSGSAGRLNASSTDGTIPPGIAAAMTQASCIIRAAVAA